MISVFDEFMICCPLLLLILFVSGLSQQEFKMLYGFIIISTDRHIINGKSLGARESRVFFCCAKNNGARGCAYYIAIVSDMATGGKPAKR